MLARVGWVPPSGSSTYKGGTTIDSESASSSGHDVHGRHKVVVAALLVGIVVAYAALAFAVYEIVVTIL